MARVNQRWPAQNSMVSFFVLVVADGNCDGICVPSGSTGKFKVPFHEFVEYVLDCVMTVQVEMI